MGDAPATEGADARRLPTDTAVALGLSAADLRGAQIVRAREGRYLLRLRRAGEACVLKWSSSAQARHEAHAYALLADLRVPTLQVLARADAALLLEDLDASPAWRLATPEDVRRPATGRAIADWYRGFHEAGEPTLAGQPASPPHSPASPTSSPRSVYPGWVSARANPATP